MKLKNHSIGKKLISALLAILMVLSAFPITSFAASANLGEVSGAKDIDVTAEFNYGHEIHYGTVNGNKYPLFCIEYGTTSPSSSYLEGKKAMASSKAVDAAKWIFAGYYLEHGNAINKLDMAYCQKKVWSIMGDSTSWTFTDSGYQAWCDNAKSNMEKLNTYPSFDGKNIGTLVAGTSTTITDTNKVLSSYPAFTYTKSGVTATHEASKNTITISVSKDCTATSFALPANKYLKNNTGDDDELLLYYPYGSKSYQKLIYSAYYDPIDVSFNASITPLGSLKLVKTSEDGNVANIKFTITGKDFSKTVTTDSKGVIELAELVPGTYTITEQSIDRYESQESKKVTIESNKTATVTFNNTLKKGNLKVQKNSEDSIVSGFTFSVKGSDGSSHSITTNSSGVATLNNLPVYDSSNNKITYTVAETSVPVRYVTPDNKTITLPTGSTSTATFNNVLKKGNIEIQKDCEDNKKSGLTFKVTGSDGSNYTVSTNANGVAYVPNIPVYDSNNNKISYTVKETSVPIRYVTPDDKVVKLNADETSTVQVNNILKKFKVEVTKVDIEKTHAQGDAKLMGAVYGIYDNDKLIDTYTTDKEGKFTTKYYVCGDNWSIKEITPSEGYILDTTVYHVGAEAKNYTVERNTTANIVKEQVIKGKISIIKHTDDGSTKIETPEKGAEFQIFLKSAGSFAKAVDTEKDTIVCDEDGFASSKLLPYGVYAVHQTKGWAGREKIKDFDVFISSEGKTYKFLINNANFMSYLKVVKVDNETGKNIAYEGAAFEIYDIDGHRVTMQYTYPQVTSIHTFYTNSEGYLITPEKLPYGDYTLVEVQAPYGYILDSTPIPFSINQENSSTDTGVTVVKVKARDVAQKGIIRITKTGEVFSTVTSECDMYTPQYEVKGLKDAIFEIFAAEDITTLDGTVRYIQGEKVDEITTDENGVAESKELYLGKYTVVEKHAPNTFVNANKQYDVELEYAGQNITLTKTELELTNQRQKVEVSLKKILEENCLFGIGNNNEISKVVFGIFAHEQITAQDETFIPEDSLIATATCDTDGNIKFDCDLPIGFNFYVKEIATDEHYILDENKYEFSTEYQGETVETIKIEISEGADIKNKLIYGCVKGLKIDRETNEPVSGATFGLFSAGTTEFTKDTALMIAKSNSGGEFEFKMLPYGEYIIKELEPAKHYLANDSVYNITINENEQIIRLEVVNDMIPEMRTTATVEGEKTICATETFTLTDKVEYKHLIPNEEYIISGILMDKSTGKPFLVNGKEVTSEVTFTPTEPNGSIDILFIFDSTSIKTETDIVVFESLYKDGQELCIHADINDKDQTVKIKIPSIKTKATVDGKKRVTASKKITIIDTVSYKNLTIGKEYVIKGILINKDTGKPFIVDGKEVTAEVKFIPETRDGEIEIKFEFDGSGIKKDVELVVFEALYRDGIELTTHADINDKGQTILIEAPKPKTPKTGDNKNYGTLFGLAFVAIGGCIAGVILKVKSRKEDEE